MVERVFLGLCLFSVLVCFSACKNKSQNAANEHQNEALSQAFAQMNGMEKKKEEVERIAEQRERERQRDSDAREWLRGTWEYRDSYGDVVCRLAVNNGCACLYTASGVSDDGHISKFDVDEGQMTFGEHSYVEFDYDKRKLYYSRMENQCLTKIDNTPKISYNNMTRVSGGATYARRGSSTRGAAQRGGHSNVTFRTDSDVLAYTMGKFKDRSGNVISVRPEGLYVNGGYPRGDLVTGAVKVVNFSGSRALLYAVNPFTQGTAYMIVDASRGTITDRSNGDVYHEI